MITVDVVSSADRLPSREEVRALYAAAAALPPLNESSASAELFASVYEASVTTERVVAVSATDEGRLVAFAYGHPWLWEAQTYAWAYQLRDLLGDDADRLDGTYSLNLLARHPDAKYRGLGRTVLARWLEAIGHGSCWLQTTDIDSPATRLYASLGFQPVGHGPEAPNGAPGLVLLRPAHGRRE